MEIYNWEKVTNDTYIFNLWIFEEEPRFGKEGILQNVELHINNFILYETTFGRETAYNHFKNMTLDNMRNYIEEYDYLTTDLSYQLDEKQFHEFKCWLLTSLTPIEKQRKEKIGRIKEKMPYATL